MLSHLIRASDYSFSQNLLIFQTCPSFQTQFKCHLFQEVFPVLLRISLIFSCTFLVESLSRKRPRARPAREYTGRKGIHSSFHPSSQPSRGNRTCAVNPTGSLNRSFFREIWDTTLSDALPSYETKNLQPANDVPKSKGRELRGKQESLKS